MPKPRDLSSYLRERAEILSAERDAAIAELAFARGDVEVMRRALERLLTCVSDKAYATHEEQEAITLARKLVKR